MKTLKNHMVLYDNECPMCKTYTMAFVKTGMLDLDGRAPYQNTMDNFCTVIDKQRAVNEIALVNTQNGEVTYGVKSLFKIIGNACPVFGPLFSFSPFAWFMTKVYAFISYNRRVIIPAGKVGNSFNYQPSFKLNYRIAYLIFTWFVTAYILTKYAQHLAGMVPLGNALREYFICGGQIIFQAIIIQFYKKPLTWEYLGNLMTISFAGSLLLTLPLLFGQYLPFTALAYTIYFIIVADLMFLEHIRRSKLLNLGWVMTITWALYRLLLLMLIYNY